LPRPIFSLIHCTARLDPHQPFYWTDTMNVWRDRCDHPDRVEYILCADKRHKQDALTPLLMGEIGYGGWNPFRAIFNEGRECAVDAWNFAAAESKGNVLITVADDYFSPEHWDTQLWEAIVAIDPTPETSLMKSLGAVLSPADWEFVLDVDNQDNSFPLLPFTFISRAYYKRLGYLFWPEYLGIGADVDFTAVARRDGVVIDARHLKFEHRHWGRGLREFDQVDAHQQSPEADRAHHSVLARREREGFPALTQEQAAEYYATLGIAAP
jgi:hypothetical protein